MRKNLHKQSASENFSGASVGDVTSKLKSCLQKTEQPFHFFVEVFENSRRPEI